MFIRFILLPLFIYICAWGGLYAALEQSHQDAFKHLGLSEERAHLHDLHRNFKMSDYTFSRDKKPEKEELIITLYVTFIAWDENRDDKTLRARARDLLNYLNEKFTKHHDPDDKGVDDDDATLEHEFLRWMVDHKFISDCAGSSYNIPLWLVIKYPRILDFEEGRYFLTVMSKDSLYDVPEFKELLALLEEMTQGRSHRTSYMTHPGTIIHDIAGVQTSFIRSLNFNPASLLPGGESADGGDNKGNDQENHKDDSPDSPDDTSHDARDEDDMLMQPPLSLSPLMAWASQGIWNSIMYEKYKRVHGACVEKLATYYKQRPFLSPYADKASYLVDCLEGAYIHELYTTPALILWARADESQHKKYLTQALKQGINFASPSFFADLKKFTQHNKDPYWDRFLSVFQPFSPDEVDDIAHRQKIGSEFLSRAILSGASVSTIELIIKLGADVNALTFGEAPLMNAANKPDVMALLIACGADVNKPNPFGKTALFYAIQFGDYRCVEFLIQKGADVNQALYGLSTFMDISHKSFDLGCYFLLEHVADFTPLVYARRYATQDVQNLLILQGAHYPPDKRDAWIRGEIQGLS